MFLVPHVNIPFLGGFHTDKLKFSFPKDKKSSVCVCNFLFCSNTLGVTIQTKQIRVRVEIIPSYSNDYMPNQKTIFPFNHYF